MNKTITINGVEYVQKEEQEKGLEYVIIRTYSAGVHAGYLKQRDENEVTLVNTRRIWYWDGACSLSQLSKDGTKAPDNCKFTCEIDTITLLNAIEVIPCTEHAIKSIKGVKEWIK